MITFDSDATSDPNVTGIVKVVRLCDIFSENFSENPLPQIENDPRARIASLLGGFKADVKHVSLRSIVLFYNVNSILSKGLLGLLVRLTAKTKMTWSVLTVAIKLTENHRIEVFEVAATDLGIARSPSAWEHKMPVLLQRTTPLYSNSLDAEVYLIDERPDV